MKAPKFPEFNDKITIYYEQTDCIFLVLRDGLLTCAGKKKPDWAGNENTEKVTDVVKSEQRTEPDKGRSESRYSSEERRVIRNYFLGADTQASGADKQKGKNKHKSLPPGLQKKLSRGGELPPGWQNKVAAGEVLDAELYSPN